jgi:hypothetical protein
MDRFDVLMVLGIALLAIGCGLIYFPLGLIAGGIGCTAIAIVGARSQALSNAEPFPAAAPQKDKA